MLTPEPVLMPEPALPPAISGRLNNCSLNCGLPSILQKFSDIAALEASGQLDLLEYDPFL